MKFLIISGLSGAGKSKVASNLEDLGFYCVDNMPVDLIPQLAGVCLATKGRWYLGFALPVTGCIALIVTAVITLLRYVKKGRLYILGGAMIAMGAVMLLVEYLLAATFHVALAGWSVYPLIGFALVGGLLIFLAINSSARERMERKFFF